MTDRTPFPTDLLDPDDTDPDLSQDDDEHRQSSGADEEHPHDRTPTLDEQTEDLIAAEERGLNEDFPAIP